MKLSLHVCGDSKRRLSGKKHWPTYVILAHTPGVKSEAGVIMDDTAAELRKRAVYEGPGVSAYVTSPGRSRNMAAIRRTDTKPELAVRSELHRRGYRFRKDLRIDLGTIRPRPDIVFTRWKVAVFIDGCFWHGCREHAGQPRQNTAYWGPKLEANIWRDRRYDAALSDAGWTVVRAWEHEEVEAVTDKIQATVVAAQQRRPQ